MRKKCYCDLLSELSLRYISIIITHAKKDLNEKALLIVDVQNDFIGDGARMPVDKKQGEKMIANLNKLVDSAKAKSLTIVYIGNEYGRFDPLNVFRNFAAIRNTDGARLSDRLHVVSKNYFSKNKANAFSNQGPYVFFGG